MRQIAALTAIAIVALVGMLFLGRLLVHPPGPAALTDGTVFRDCATCPLMLVLQAGQVRAGLGRERSRAQRRSSSRRMAVQIAYPLAAGINEVTVGEYAEFAKEHPRVSEGCMTYDGEWKLRASVDWRNATPGADVVASGDLREFPGRHRLRGVAVGAAPGQTTGCRARRSGNTWRAPAPRRRRGRRRRTPAKARTSPIQSAAQQFPGWDAFACTDSFVQAAPVGSFTANAFGLTDTLGNVFEWVQDCWRDDYVGAPVDGAAASDGDCTQREARGGSWFTKPAFVRAAYRNRFEADYRSSSLGFRVVREIRNEK